MSVKRSPADNWFSKALRESYDYECQSCKRNYRHDPGYLHAMHVHTRKHRSTRWDGEYGAIPGCARCHRRYTDYPLEWADFCRRFLGDSNYDEAKRRAWSVRKYTKQEQKDIADHYRTECKRIEQLRAEGETGYIRLVSYD